MVKETIRTHVVLPRELVEAVDRIVGSRRRSQYVEDAVSEKLMRDRQRAALEQYAGILDPAAHPEWSTPEQTSAWVRDLRAQAEERTARKLARAKV
jgi:metal-responsive CopG/Arc/MetJ family transcriptional regulator